MTTARVTSVLSALILIAAVLPALRASADFAYQPLWPFASQDEADRWLQQSAATGSAPWHADPETTALLFTQNYLGFRELDRTTTVTEHADEAWVGVGYGRPDSESSTAATIHLVRFGSAPNSPWEVVGSDDEALTLSTPSYGSAVGTVIDAGGTITGVDESLHLQVRQSTKEDPLGDYCCVPAGGESRPWSASFTMAPRQPGSLTLVVWTGGHVVNVEKFAVTGLHTA